MDLEIDVGNVHYLATFFDPNRLAQEIADELADGSPAWTEVNLVVIPTVSRQAIEAAVDHLAKSDFADLRPR